MSLSGIASRETELTRKYREHTMMRFVGGTPTAIWYSQHEYGEAFLYQAVQKAEDRPICFSAKGSHANYAVAGKHDLHKISEYFISFTHTHRLRVLQMS